MYSIEKKTVFLAGIYEKNSFCLITEQADPEIEKIHIRQPVILFEEDIEDYLNLNIYDMKDYSGSPVDIMNLVEEYINDRNYDKKVKNRIITEVMELYNKCSKV